MLIHTRGSISYSVPAKRAANAHYVNTLLQVQNFLMDGKMNMPTGSVS